MFDLTSNFFDNSQYRVIFKDDINTPSEVMWALMLIYHPKSEYYEMPLSSRINLVLKDQGISGYDITTHQPTIDKIQLIYLTKTQMSLFNWEKKLEERDAFIASHPYDANTYEMLDKLMSSTPKLWDQFFSLQKQLEKEEGKTRGDIEESLTDKNII